MKLTTPADFAGYWHSHIATAPRFKPAVETLVVLTLEPDDELIACYIVSTGTLDYVCAYPGAVFRPALTHGANQIVLMHNHPDGYAVPSMADIHLTADLVAASRRLRLKLRDHIIIGKPILGNAAGYCSLAGLGYFHA